MLTKQTNILLRPSRVCQERGWDSTVEFGAWLQGPMLLFFTLKHFKVSTFRCIEPLLLVLTYLRVHLWHLKQSATDLSLTSFTIIVLQRVTLNKLASDSYPAAAPASDILCAEIWCWSRVGRECVLDRQGNKSELLSFSVKITELKILKQPLLKEIRPSGFHKRPLIRYAYSHGDQKK